MQLVDSHCHINVEPLGARTDEILRNAANQGVDYMLCVSVNMEDYPEVLTLAHGHRNVYASVGVHPNETSGREPDADELCGHAQDPEVVAQRAAAVQGQGQREIAFQVPLVELVEDHQPHTGQVRLTLQAPGQHPFGDHLDAGLLGYGGFETHPEPYALPDGTKITQI